MPNRILKESICSSEEVDQLTLFQEVFFYRLIVNCDDFGRMDARPRILCAKLFPLREVKQKNILESLHALASAGLILLYEDGGHPYLQMKTWDRHQSIRAKKSKYPSPDECNQICADEIICKQMNADESKCPRNPIQSNPIRNPNPMREGKTDKRFTPPSLPEVTAYCFERKNGIDPEQFIAYYAARDWCLGKGQKMKDWKAAVIYWEKNEGRFDNGKSGQVDKRNSGETRQDYSDLYNGPGAVQL